MNKLEANIALLSVTMCWSIQYFFYQSVPESMSVFGFMTVTNLLGLLILCAVFFREIKNITMQTFFKGLSLGFVATLYNLFFISGSKILSASTAAFSGTLYIIFVPVLVLIVFKEKIHLNNLLAMVLILIGIWIAAGANLADVLHPGILLMLAGDVVFAVYIIMLGHYAKTSAPSHISIIQLLFSAVFSSIAWFLFTPGGSIGIPVEPSFWSSVLVIAVFVRAYSTIMQIYAQRYASAIDSSVIFSTEVVFTMLFSMCLPLVVGMQSVFPAVREVLGCVVLVAGIIISGIELPSIRKCFDLLAGIVKKTDTQKRFIIGIVLYTIVNISFRTTFTGLPFAGPAAAVSFVLGMLFGFAGAASSALGSILSDLSCGSMSGMSMFTAISVFTFSAGTYWLWHTALHIPLKLKKAGNIFRLIAFLSAASLAASLLTALGQAYLGFEITAVPVCLTHFVWGLLIGIPLIILLTSVLGVNAAAPAASSQHASGDIFNRTIHNKVEDISVLCDSLSDYCRGAGIGGTRAYNIVLSVEEMLVNIIENSYVDDELHPISVTVTAQDLVMIRIENEGVNFNPVNFHKHPVSIRQLFQRAKPGDVDTDMLGIIMVTKIAIKVEHRFKWGMNTLTILL